MTLRKAELELQHTQGAHLERGFSPFSTSTGMISCLGCPLTAGGCSQQSSQELSCPKLCSLADLSVPNPTLRHRERRRCSFSAATTFPEQLCPIFFQSQINFSTIFLFFPLLKFPQLFPYITSCSLQFRYRSLPFQLSWAEQGLGSGCSPCARIWALVQISSD